MNVQTRLPAPVQPILADIIALLNNRLPGRICGFYLVGSIALDEFNEHFSDIDFVAILNQRAAAEEIEELRRIHRALEKKHPRWKMSGSYILPSDLGKLEHEIEPHLLYHDGVLHSASRAGLNLITWWELKNHGLALTGAAASALPLTVDPALLVAKTKENMDRYWTRWTNRPDRILVLYSNWGIQWAVLGVLRQLYTLRERSITTKVRAARYALGCLPGRWHKLIREAVHIRQGEKGSTYRFRIARTVAAVRFLKYIIEFCNTTCPAR